MNYKDQKDIYQVKQCQIDLPVYYVYISNGLTKNDFEIANSFEKIKIVKLNLDKVILLKDFIQIMKYQQPKINIKDQIKVQEFINKIKNQENLSIDQICFQQNAKKEFELVSLQNQTSKEQQSSIYEIIDKFNQIQENLDSKGKVQPLSNCAKQVQQFLVQITDFQKKENQKLKTESDYIKSILQQRLFIKCQQQKIDLFLYNFKINFQISPIFQNQGLMEQYFNFLYYAESQEIQKFEQSISQLSKSTIDESLFICQKNTKTETQQKFSKEQYNQFTQYIIKEVQEQLLLDIKISQQIQQDQKIQDFLQENFNKIQNHIDFSNQSQLQKSISIKQIINKMIYEIYNIQIQQIHEEINSIQEVQHLQNFFEIQRQILLDEIKFTHPQNQYDILYSYSNRIKKIAQLNNSDISYIFQSSDQIEQLRKLFETHQYLPETFQTSLSELSNKFCSVQQIEKSNRFMKFKKNLEDIEQMNLKIIFNWNSMFPQQESERILRQKVYNKRIEKFSLFDDNDQFLNVIFTQDYDDELKSFPAENSYQDELQNQMKNDLSKCLFSFCKEFYIKEFKQKKQSRFCQNFEQVTDQVEQKYKSCIEDFFKENSDQQHTSILDFIKQLEEQIKQQNSLDDVQLLIITQITQMQVLRQNESLYHKITKLFQDKCNQILIQPFQVQQIQVDENDYKLETEQFQKKILDLYQNQILQQLQKVQ